MEHATIKQIFNEIEKQTTYRIGYSETDLDIHKNINLPALTYILTQLFSLMLKNSGLEYMIKDDYILIVSNDKKTGPA